MKFLGCLLAGLSVVASAQPGSAPRPADAVKAENAGSAENKRIHELPLRALGAVQAEQARAKQPLCPKAATTLAINSCDARELDMTERNYLVLTRTLGLMLRGEGEEAKRPPRRIPFDDAEATWHSYREQACLADGLQYEGGTIRPSIEMSCKIALTRHHMNELWELYEDLGTR